MKRLVMAMSALLVSVTMSFAQESSLHKEPFVVNVGQLVSYLELRPSQINEVAMINDYFREKQSEGLRGSHKMRDKRMRQAVFGNLKLMKKALSTDSSEFQSGVIAGTSTRSPGLKSFTNSPTSTTSAQHSCPRIIL